MNQGRMEDIPTIVESFDKKTIDGMHIMITAIYNALFRRPSTNKAKEREARIASMQAKVLMKSIKTK